MKKRGIFVALLMVIFLANFVFAVDDSQEILRLSSITNAHGEMPGQDYPIVIKYSELFGENYTGQNPNNCDGTNKILRLSSITNAHAEDPSLSNYANEVCYGDLSCTLRNISSSGDCNTDETMIIKLSSTTNAHLATADSSADYNFAICCIGETTPPPPPIEEDSYYWADLSGVNISSAREGDEVKAMINTGIANAEITFEIFEKDFAFDDLIMGNIDLTTDDNGRVEYYWTIDLTGLDSEADDEQEIYFMVEFEKEGEIVTRESNELLVPEGEIIDECNVFYLNDDNQQEYIEYCDDYNRIDGDSGEKESQCEADCNDVYESEIIVTEEATGIDIESGSCVWRDVSGEENCRFEYTTGEPPIDPLVCSQESTFGDCVSGFRQVTHSYIKISGDGTCPADESITIPCPRSIELPVFGWAGLIISIIIIAIIYLSQFKNKKRK